jgi:hypothetical protein
MWWLPPLNRNQSLPMKSPFLIPLFFCAVMASRVAAQSPTVEFSAVQFVARSYGTGNDALRPFQLFDDGVKVAILVKSEAGGITALDLKKGSTIETFTDDKGTKLFKPSTFKNGFGSFPKISKDGKAAIITVEGTEVPAAGASTIQLKGKVGVTMATTKETVKGGKVAVDGKLACGTLSLTVKQLRKSGSEMSVELETSESTEQIAEMRWLDAAGKVLEANRDSSSQMGFGGKVTYSESWTVKGSPATVEFVRWTDLKAVSVPFSFEIAVGAKAGK